MALCVVTIVTSLRGALVISPDNNGSTVGPGGAEPPPSSQNPRDIVTGLNSIPAL